MTTRVWLPLCLLLAATFGCESSQEGADSQSPPEAAADAAVTDATDAATDAVGGDPKAPDKFEVALDTTEGEVVIEVDRSLAPHGADRFHRLVKEGFYDGAKFFRVLPGFVAQVGMAGDPKVNAKYQEAMIPADPVKTSNTPGTVTFAMGGNPNTRTAQIFINYGDNSRLDADGFAPFGVVKKGMETVEKFYSGYGEAPDQGAIAAQGNQYLEAEFPELDAIKTARVVSENGQPVSNEAAAPEAEAATDVEPTDADGAAE